MERAMAYTGGGLSNELVLCPFCVILQQSDTTPFSQEILIIFYAFK
jgi:hypothetical protein